MKHQPRNWRVVLLVLIGYAVVLHSQRRSHLCPCYNGFDPRNGSLRRLECNVGGMQRIPIHCLDEDVQQLIITPESYDPNNLTIGLILTHPHPYNNLREITIINSNLPTIGQFAFWGLSDLRHLNLTCNIISRIFTDNFRGLYNLLTLSLDFNLIEEMASETFRHMENLTKLTLSHNNIRTLVPRLFRMLGKLTFLDLSFNPIHDLNPEVFRDIQNIITFKCRKCYLRRINVQIYHIAPSIEELDLGENLFNFLMDDDFSNLKKLKRLKFDGNQLTVIVDNVFKQNAHLQHLDVSHNHITVLAPGSLSKLTNLEHLDISYNRLDKITPQTFASISKSLKFINLSGNKMSINEIATVLQTLPAIQNICLTNVSLKTIPPKLFTYNKQLVTLDISSNELAEFPSATLTNIKCLKSLDISRNKLTSLSEPHLQILEGIPHITLSSNPWKCDQCSMQATLAYMNSTVLRETLRKLKCDTPSRLHGVYFVNLTPTSLQPCFSTYEVQMSIAACLMLLALSVFTTGAIALYCTRHRGAQYYTNEGKRRNNHPEELISSTNTASVSTIHSPTHHTETNT